MYRGSYCSPLLKSVKTVEMTLDDLNEVLEIEQCSFPTPWSKELFLKELHSESSKIFLAKSNFLGKQRVLGYISIWFVNEEVHILNLACHPNFRRSGVAKSLIEYSLSFSFQIGARRVFLDVRETNHAALSLYKKYGFKPIGIRKGYYSDTQEDAIVMVLEMESKSLFKNFFTSCPVADKGRH